MSDLNIIKSKIKKLLALSKSPNENEAALALEKATALMAQYQLDESEFSGYTQKSVKSTKRYVEWRAIVANAVENLYATYHYRNANTGEFIFYGEELDVFMSTEMFSYLIKTIDRMASQNIRKNAKYHFRQSYRSGLASRLYYRMEELGQNCSWRSPEELAKTKQEICDYVNNSKELSVRPVKTGRMNIKAWCRGQNDADGISLSRQMNASHGRLISGW